MINSVSGSFSGSPVDILSGVPVEDEYVSFRISDHEYAIAQGDIRLENNKLCIDNATVTIYDMRGYSEYVDGRLYTYPVIRTLQDDVSADITTSMVYSSYDGFPHLSQNDVQTSNIKAVGIVISVLLVFIVLWGFLKGSVLRLRRD